MASDDSAGLSGGADSATGVCTARTAADVDVVHDCGQGTAAAGSVGELPAPPTDADVPAPPTDAELPAPPTGAELPARETDAEVPARRTDAEVPATTAARDVSAAPHPARRGFPNAGVTPDGIPRLTRRRNDSIVGGVGGGIADHLGVPVLGVRLAFALAAVIAGAGVLAYALLWIFVPPADDRRLADHDGADAHIDDGASGEQSRRSAAMERRQAYGIAALGLALVLAATATGVGQVLGWVLGPLGLAAVGGAFIWREADDARRARWRRTAAGIVGPSRGTAWRVGGGAVLVVGGLSIFALGQLDFTAVRSALIAVLLTLVGVAVITVPWWLRLVRDLGNERQGRIREGERAELAAHLHDSVLQTLTLIQRQSGDAREVVRLARSQERELRSWLYGPAGYAAGGGGMFAAPTTFAAALAAVAGEVEDTYALPLTPVVVGDRPLDEHLAALVAASREAMVNAAKHSGAPDVSVYAEIEDGTASVFVRDRGVGFAAEAVSTDRRGLTESIRGRMERHGGKAVIRSTPGEGTEVELQMPIAAGAPGGGPAGRSATAEVTRTPPPSGLIGEMEGAPSA